MGFSNLINPLRKLNSYWLLHGSGRVFLIGLASRLLIFVSAIVSFSVFGNRTLPNVSLPDIQIPVINLFSRWDSFQYSSIALYGYPSGSNPVGIQWAWFPLYPLVMRAGGSLFLGLLSPDEAVILSGFLINNVLFFVSLMLFYKLSEKVLDSSHFALLSSIFFAFWPGALFYSCVYSESLFMSLALGGFYFLEKEDGKKSALLCFLAGFARSNGFLVFIPFLFKGLQKRNYRSIMQSFFVASPYLWFSLFGYFSTGVFPVREIAASTYWGRVDFLPIQIISTEDYLGTLIPETQILGFASILSVETFLILLPFVYQLFLKGRQIASFSQNFRLDRSCTKYWVFASVILAMILFYSVAFSIQRYALPILPLYWVPAKIWSKNQKLGIALLLTMTAILIVGTALFATWRQYY